MPLHVGKTAWAALSLLVLSLPAVAAGTGHHPAAGRADAPPPGGSGTWEVAASAVNVRRDHSVNETVLGLARCRDRVEIVDTWISPLGARWSRVVVGRTGLTGWVLWSFLSRPHPAGPRVGHCPTPPAAPPGPR
ncbi:SH3 domain-containing protein [Streptomyces sp. BE303]|uniref:SH3 domain-containing protein n=1 Tax=Streptomyces sp. BE303 TaxID=3002528 RepID=UPI002E764838|nr:SH3 domain-containing protein [Streptomyces sp. BE303]MED7955105.1 SH3 domain-containing protein [Streptomyces sp. BE303]